MHISSLRLEWRDSLTQESTLHTKITMNIEVQDQGTRWVLSKQWAIEHQGLRSNVDWWLQLLQNLQIVKKNTKLQPWIGYLGFMDIRTECSYYLGLEGFKIWELSLLVIFLSLEGWSLNVEAPPYCLVNKLQLPVTLNASRNKWHFEASCALAPMHTWSTYPISWMYFWSLVSGEV
jgi:hypothetical protein